MQSITIAYILLSSSCLFLVLKGFSYGLRKSTIERSKQFKIFRSGTIGIFLWLILVSILASAGFFKDFSTFPPKITLVLVPPMIIWLIITVKSKFLKRVLDKIPPHWIIGLQSFRIIVELLLWKQFLMGITPIQMTFEGQNFDVLVGLTAPLMAYLYRGNPGKYRKAAIAWNIAGLGLLMNILVVAILSFPTKIRYFMNEPANTFVTEFPGVLLPAFLVMIAYTMHYFSLKQLFSRELNT